MFWQFTSYTIISPYCDDWTQEEERKTALSNPVSYSTLTCTSLWGGKRGGGGKQNVHINGGVL